MARRDLVIDSCCVINLLATGREMDIVRGLDVRLLDTVYTSDEPRILWTPPDEEGRRGREARSAAVLRAAGLIVTRELDSETLTDAFVLAAEQISDPDASCIALAGVLQLPLVTDDRKERRVATDLFPGIELVSTLDILDGARVALGWENDEVARVAADLRWRGNFAPPRNDPRSPWYMALLRHAGLEGS